MRQIRKCLRDRSEYQKTVPEAIAIDSSGNVYVTSYSIGPQSTDYATIKYNSSGQEQWVARYDGLGRRGDYARSIAIDALGKCICYR
ncbi:MAG: SBBP repeat-containing protein [Ignavibacteria bacterium]|nr:SBBP repeat-containing protein [Ignavibacteria bacterium]